MLPHPLNTNFFIAFSTNWLCEGSTSRYTCKEQQILRPGSLRNSQSLYSLVHSLRPSVFFLSTSSFNNYSDKKYSAHSEAQRFPPCSLLQVSITEALFYFSRTLCASDLEYALDPYAVSTTRRALSLQRRRLS